MPCGPGPSAGVPISDEEQVTRGCLAQCLASPSVVPQLFLPSQEVASQGKSRTANVGADSAVKGPEPSSHGRTVITQTQRMHTQVSRARGSIGVALATRGSLL